jgi:hypothetical protein
MMRRSSAHPENTTHQAVAVCGRGLPQDFCRVLKLTRWYVGALGITLQMNDFFAPEAALAVATLRGVSRRPYSAILVSDDNSTEVCTKPSA